MCQYYIFYVWTSIIKSGLFINILWISHFFKKLSVHNYYTSIQACMYIALQ